MIIAEEIDALKFDAGRLFNFAISCPNVFILGKAPNQKIVGTSNDVTIEKFIALPSCSYAKVVLSPYTRVEMSTILSAEVREASNGNHMNDLFTADSIDFLAKSAEKAGDIRVAINSARACVEKKMARRMFNSVTLDDARKEIGNCQPTIDVVKKLSPYSAIVLISAYNLSTELCGKKKEDVLVDARKTMRALALDIPKEFEELADKLIGQGVLSIRNGEIFLGMPEAMIKDGLSLFEALQRFIK